MLKVILIISFIAGGRIEIHPTPDLPVFGRDACIASLNDLYNHVQTPEILAGILARKGRIKNIRGRCKKIKNRELFAIQAEVSERLLDIYIEGTNPSVRGLDAGQRTSFAITEPLQLVLNCYQPLVNIVGDALAIGAVTAVRVRCLRLQRTWSNSSSSAASSSKIVRTEDRASGGTARLTC